MTETLILPARAPASPAAAAAPAAAAPATAAARSGRRAAPGLRRAHGWPGLVLGLLLALVAASGTVLSVQPARERAAAPSQVPSIAAMVEAVTAAQPGTQAITRSPNGVLSAQLRDAVGRRVVTVDPLTGATRPEIAKGPVLRAITAFHRTLLMGEAGRAAVGLLAAAMAGLAATGAALLLRALGGWRRAGGRVRATGAKGWHARIGRVALAGLAVSGLTGAWLSAATFGLVPDGAAPVPMPVAAPAPVAAPVPVAAALAGPLADLRRIDLPARPGDPIRLETAAGVALVDPASGAVLAGAPRGVGARLWDWAYRLHSGEGLWLWGLVLGFSAAGVPLLAATGAAVWAQGRRGAARLRGNVPMAEADLVILVGSEGGTTRGFAASLHAALSAAGRRVHLGDMATVGPMPRAEALIVMTATCGEGAAPASAAGFEARLALAGPRPVAVLGFGDRTFPAFCAHADRVAADLHRRGWPELLPPARIDRQSPAAFLAWGKALGAALGVAIAPEHSPALPHRHGLTLIARRDAGAAGAPVVLLRFAVRPRWRGGPRFAAGDVLGVVAPGAGAPRFYSLASSDRDGFVELCVRQVPGGVCSTWLHGLRPGDRIAGFVRRSAGFPAADAPVVMIATGCGIAPMIALLRGAAPGPERALYLGLRDPAADLLYAEEVAGWQADGRLTRLDLAVSRPGAGPGPGPGPGQAPAHVQDRLRADAARLREQIGRGARVLVCGGVVMGRGVAAELDAILAPAGSSVAALKGEGRYVEEVY